MNVRTTLLEASCRQWGEGARGGVSERRRQRGQAGMKGWKGASCGRLLATLGPDLEDSASCRHHWLAERHTLCEEIGAIWDEHNAGGVVSDQLEEDCSVIAHAVANRAPAWSSEEAPLTHMHFASAYSGAAAEVSAPCFQPVAAPSQDSSGHAKPFGCMARRLAPRWSCLARTSELPQVWVCASWVCTSRRSVSAADHGPPMPVGCRSRSVEHGCQRIV